jgi:hypothetical protein
MRKVAHDIINITIAVAGIGIIAGVIDWNFRLILASATTFITGTAAGTVFYKCPHCEKRPILRRLIMPWVALFSPDSFLIDALSFRRCPSCKNNLFSDKKR